YAGAAQKQRLAAALAKHAGVNEEIVRFALFDSEGYESIGANRNALLLLSAGRLVFSADDDTECRLFTSADTRSLRIADEQDPTQFEFLPSREAAIARARGEQPDLLAHYERLLGHKLGVLAAQADGRGQLELGALCEHVFDA